MRDYRDAKAMAHSLREALAEKSITVNHSACLELIAKLLGVDTWNILSAQIDRAGADSPAAQPLQQVNEEKRTLYCSFCGKSQYEVQKLIAGPSVFICDECTRLCVDIIEEPGLYALILDDVTPAHEYVRGRTSEQLAAFLRASRRSVSWETDVLRQISARLDFDDFAEAPPMTAGAQRFNSKARTELPTLLRELEASIGRRERANAAVQSVLDERAAR